MKTKKANKKIKYIFLSTLAVLLGCLMVWLLEEFKAEDIAVNELKSENVNEDETGLITVLSDEESDIGFIFYPGAKVEYIAYLPILQTISSTANINCYLVEMPLNYAFFDEDVALEIINKNPEINSWYIGGHSLGSSIAGSFAGDNKNLFDGVIYLGGYVYGDYPKEKSLTIYGSLETRVDSIINYTDNVVKIEGANHSQFGNYGLQPGDSKAQITYEEQQKITASAVDEFINDK